MTSRGRAEAALIAVTLIWGTTFTLVKDALADVSTLTFLAIRFGVAAMLVSLLWRRQALTRGGPPGATLWSVTAGLCLAGSYILQTAGLRWTTPSKSAFLTSLCVVLVPLLASIVYRTVPRKQESLGVFLAMAGMALLTAPPVGNGTFVWNRGDLLTFGCAVAFAAHILLVSAAGERVRFEKLTVIQLITAAVILLGTFWWAETPVLQMSGAVWLALAVTSIFSTALAFSVQAWAQQHTTATRAALIFALEPVSASATSWLASGETLTARGWAGAVLILAGLLIVEVKPGARTGHQY